MFLCGFLQLLSQLLQERFNAIIEIGPHPALEGPMKQILAELPLKQQNTPTFCPMNRNNVHKQMEHFQKFIGNLYVNGCKVNWRSLFYWPSPTHSPCHWMPRLGCQMHQSHESKALHVHFLLLNRILFIAIAVLNVEQLQWHQFDDFLVHI